MNCSNGNTDSVPNGFRRYQCRAGSSMACSLIMLFVLLFIVADVSWAESERPDLATASTVMERPQWELGIAGGAFHGFDYPASNDRNQRSILLPFVVYRTPLFRFGGGGVRAVAIENPRVKLDLSIGGSLNASSEGNSVREGMPDLDFLFELGPQLEVRLFDKKLDSGELLLGRFTSELRAVFSTDFRGVDQQGYVAEFGLGLRLRNIRKSRVDLLSGLDITFASERLQDYFYEVGPEDATTTRAVYDAKGGYLETSLFLGLAYRPMPSLSIFAGVIPGYYNGASNERSPLFETTHHVRYALGVAWTIKRSRKMVEIVDMGAQQ
ncbi:MAG: MipA/OmpV family protein [Granulosicoccus sp.]